MGAMNGFADSSVLPLSTVDQCNEVFRQHLRVVSQNDLQLRKVAALMSGGASACEANI